MAHEFQKSLLGKIRRAAKPVTKRIEAVLGPNDPLHAKRENNQKAANKLRKLRIQNRNKRAAADKKSGLRQRIK